MSPAGDLAFKVVYRGNESWVWGFTPPLYPTPPYCPAPMKPLTMASRAGNKPSLTFPQKESKVMLGWPRTILMLLQGTHADSFIFFSWTDSGKKKKKQFAWGIGWESETWTWTQDSWLQPLFSKRHGTLKTSELYHMRVFKSEEGGKWRQTDRQTGHLSAILSIIPLVLLCADNSTS